jgi:hypothetical protein
VRCSMVLLVKLSNRSKEGQDTNPMCHSSEEEHQETAVIEVHEC